MMIEDGREYFTTENIILLCIISGPFSLERYRQFRRVNCRSGERMIDVEITKLMMS